MSDDKFIMFKNRLEKVFKHLGKQAKKQEVSCYRLYDHDLPEFPVCIEVYDQYVYIAEYRRKHGMDESAHGLWLSKGLDVISSVLTIERENLFVKERYRKEGRKDQYQKTGYAKNEFIVDESGLKFIINLNDYLDTGLFLDHRLTRQIVRKESDNKKVLNLFAYTGSFSVYAAAGNAAEVVTVDMSNTYLDWAKKNMLLNDFLSVEKYKYIQADVMQYLKEINEEYFDLIILDPPTFSNSKRMKDILDIQRDHVKLIKSCLKLLNKEGSIYFSTNYTKFNFDSAAFSDGQIKDITKQTTPFDFQGRLNRVCFLIKK